MKNKPIPNRLREYRKLANLRQTDVANKLGFKSNDRISHWEKGIAVPSLMNALRIAKLYEATIEQLYETN